MKKNFFQVILLVVALGLISSSLLGGVLAASSTNDATTTVDSRWELRIDGSNGTLALSLDDLAAMPKTYVSADLYCGGIFVEGGEWAGVQVGLLLEKAGFNPPATDFTFSASDRYSLSISMTDCLRDDVIIAYEKDGQPLPVTLRLVIPGANGDSWVAMVTAITATNSFKTYQTSGTPDEYAQQPLPPNPLLPTQQPSSTSKLQPSPTTQPDNQSTTPPVALPPNSQPVQQQDSSNSSFSINNLYPLLAATLPATAAITGYLLYKRKK